MLTVTPQVESLTDILSWKCMEVTRGLNVYIYIYIYIYRLIVCNMLRHVIWVVIGELVKKYTRFCL